MKTLAKEAVEKRIERAKESVAIEIEQTLVSFQGSIMEVENRYRYKLGGLFRFLRSLFDQDGKSEQECSREFNAYCEDRFDVRRPQRYEYMQYHERSGGELPSSAEDGEAPDNLKPMTHLTRNRNRNDGDTRDIYKKIVNKAIANKERWKVAVQKRERENELICELASKIIEVGFRTLSVKLHPDKDGGSDEAQKRLHAAKQMLVKLLDHQSLRM